MIHMTFKQLFSLFVALIPLVLLMTLAYISMTTHYGYTPSMSVYLIVCASITCGFCYSVENKEIDNNNINK